MIVLNKYPLLLLILAILLLGSCKKDDSVTRPTLDLISPVENAAFNTGDTMEIIGNINHNTTINTVKIVIKDGSNNTVTVPKYLYPASSTYHLEIEYVIDAPSLVSGTYVLVIGISDGQMETNFFVNIRITGVDKFFQKAIVLCRPSILKTYIYSLDSGWHQQNILNLNYGFIDSDISSKERKLYVVKPQPSILYAYDLDDPVPDFWLDASPPYPVFHNVYYNDPLAYVSSANGDIKGLNSFGNTTYLTPQNQDTIPLLLQRHNNVMLSYCKRRGGPEHVVRQNYMGTGVLRTYLKVIFNIAAMFEADNDFCLLFTDNESNSEIHWYHVEENYLDLHINLPEGNIRDVVKISGTDYLIAHDAGIYHYSYKNTYAVEWKFGLDIDFTAFDATRQYLFTAKGQTLTVFRVDTGDLIKQISMPYPVYAIHIQHNI